MNTFNSIERKIILIEVSKLTNLFMIKDVAVDVAQDDTYIYKALLYSEKQLLSVTWLSDKPRHELQKGESPLTL